LETAAGLVRAVVDGDIEIQIKVQGKKK
jgi:hypothetical protein